MNNHQRELLTMLAEEASEVAIACTKALRHGLDSYHPDHPKRTNTDDLRNELADLYAVVSMLSEEVKGVEPDGMDVSQSWKAKQRWMHTKPGDDQ